MCSVVTQHNILNSNKNLSFGRATTKILATGKVKILSYCSVPQILQALWMIWSSYSSADDGSSPLECNSGQNFPELLRNTTKTLVILTFLQEEICAKVLHNNDAGMQNIRPQPSVRTRWFKYDRDWFVCKQAALRSSCATLREWSHNLHPPSCSG